MKHLLPCALIVLVLLTSGCGLKEVIGPNGIGGTTNSDSYQPITKGSTWNYSVQIIGTPAPDHILLVMTGNVKTFNGKLYYEGTETSSTDVATGYFSHTGNLYTDRIEDPNPDDTTDEPYLNDALPPGATYTTKANDSGTSHGAEVQYLGTILEKGVTKTVNGKNFTNVIHTRVEFQAKLPGGTFVTSDVTEYYVAKGVGIIEVDAYFLNPFTNTKELAAKQTIVSYNIK